MLAIGGANRDQNPTSGWIELTRRLNGQLLSIFSPFYFRRDFLIWVSGFFKRRWKPSQLCAGDLLPLISWTANWSGKDLQNFCSFSLPWLISIEFKRYFGEMWPIQRFVRLNAESAELIRSFFRTAECAAMHRVIIASLRNWKKTEAQRATIPVPTVAKKSPKKHWSELMKMNKLANRYLILWN